MGLRSILIVTSSSVCQGDLSVVLTNRAGSAIVSTCLSDPGVFRGLALDAVCYTSEVAVIVNSAPFRSVLEVALSGSPYGFWVEVDRHSIMDIDMMADFPVNRTDWLANLF